MKTRILSILILLVYSHISFAQQVDFCRYFKIRITEWELNGKRTRGKSIEIKEDQNDPFGKHLKKHSLRYDYLLFKSNLLLDSNYNSLLLNKEKIDSMFCQSMKKDSSFNNYFSYLSPIQFATQKISLKEFTTAEMMLVASRFFYCDEIDKADTSVGYHICVGLNGIKEIQSQKDLTVLEAFCIEGIFDAISNKREAKFKKDFSVYIQKSRNEHEKNFNTFYDLLLSIRKDCFRDMEQNQDLRKSLLAYYNKNKNNINFTIQQN